MKDRTARQLREAYLRGTLEDCERQLVKLGKRADAWRLLEIVPDGTPRPVIGKGAEAQEALGREFDVVKPATRRTADLPAYKQLTRIGAKIAASEGVTSAEALVRATNRNPTLYERYLKQSKAALGEVRLRPAWRLAEAAALMAHALTRLDDPEAMFAAGLAYGEHHQFDHQERRRQLAERMLKREFEKKIDEARLSLPRKGGNARADEYAEATSELHGLIVAEGERLSGTIKSKFRVAEILAQREDVRRLGTTTRGKPLKLSGIRALLRRSQKVAK